MVDEGFSGTALSRSDITRRENLTTTQIRTDPGETVRKIIGVAEEKKAHKVVALDVRGLTIVTDYFVIASADNQTAVKSLSKGVIERLMQSGIKPLHVEGTAAGGWILLDYGDAVVHIFLNETRLFYDLDGLWGDAPLFAR